MKGRISHKTKSRASGGFAGVSAQPWKSGASAPRQSASESEGFSPRAPQGLKAASPRLRNAALKGPLFHGAVGVPLWLLATCLTVTFFASHAIAQVTFDRLSNAGKEPQNWMTYSGDYSGKRFSGLDQINTTNARNMVTKWVYQTGATGKLETSPLVVDGILYATAQDNRAFALDARTGRPIWMYQRQVPADIRPCCGHVNRGLAILGDKVFMGTLDAHVIALDSKTGAVVWDLTAADYRTGHSFTVAPLAVKNLVVIGVSGGEYGVRGFIDAYDADTGARKWRFYTVPGPGEPGHETWEGESWRVGGAPAWNTGTYDAATNQIFWPTGNPAPSNRGEGRAGDNLYSNSLLALDADTGKLNWHFQFTKHDEHDWDATQVPVMIDTGGRHLIAQADRNGFFYVIDRSSGKLISATAYGKTTWSDTKDAEGRPVARVKWKFQHTSPTWSGVLSTAGGLVFSGDAEGNFIAFEAASGKPLWHFQMGGAVYAPPVAFAVDGKEYVVIAAGSGLFAFGLP